MSRTGQAEELAEAVAELAEAAAVLNAAIWAAGVDPQATASLVNGAVVLGAQLSALFPAGPVVRDDRQMLSSAADLEAGAGELLHATQSLREATETALADAQAAAARARKDDDRAAQRAAEAQIADCEAALDILAGLLGPLGHALGQFQLIPDDLAVTYESCYSHLARGGALPLRGDFLTGVRS